MKLTIQSILLSTVFFTSTIIFSWEEVSIKTAELEKTSAPNFTVLLEKESYVLNELVSARFILENPHDSKIVIRNEMLYDPLSMIGITLQLFNSENKRIPPYYATRGDYIVSNYFVMDPHEIIYQDYNLNYHIDSLGEYRIKAGYSWRYAKSLDPFDKESMAYTKKPKLIIEDPQGVDKEALEFVGDSELLLCLQDNDLLMTRKDIKKLEYKNTEDKKRIMTEKKEEINQLRIKFLDKFPTSTYARNVLFALSQRLKRDKKFSAAIEQFKRYIKLHPTSWFVDDALFHIVECNIELKEIDEAKKTLERLTHMYTDAKIQRKTLRIKTNLEKGYKTLDQIYSH